MAPSGIQLIGANWNLAVHGETEIGGHLKNWVRLPEIPLGKPNKRNQMGISIDLNIYDAKQLKQSFVNAGATDEELLTKIMAKFGTFLADKYLLVNNEYGGDYSPYYNLTGAIDKVFKIKDCYMRMYDQERESGICWANEAEVLEELFPDKEFEDPDEDE